jgi:hypothetical protein
LCACSEFPTHVSCNGQAACGLTASYASCACPVGQVSWSSTSARSQLQQTSCVARPPTALLCVGTVHASKGGVLLLGRGFRLRFQLRLVFAFNCVWCSGRPSATAACWVHSAPALHGTSPTAYLSTPAPLWCVLQASIVLLCLQLSTPSLASCAGLRRCAHAASAPAYAASFLPRCWHAPHPQQAAVMCCILNAQALSNASADTQRKQ